MIYLSFEWVSEWEEEREREREREREESIFIATTREFAIVVTTSVS